MKQILFSLATVFLLSFSLTGQTCALSITVVVGECDPNGEVSLEITISDPSDNARDVDVSVDDVLLPGSPFRVRDDTPVFLTTTVPGDGLPHVISAVSEDQENCSAQTTVNAPDCSSDCFLSGLQLSFDGGTTHTVDVGTGGNNVFTPAQTTITIGDIVSFNFVDDGHTTTSDATTGPDSWNSGLRGNGTSFPVTIINPGLHRYYCVPHGGTNGSGMAGSIVANCPGGAGFGLTAAFNSTLAGAAGYNLLVDGQVQAGSPFSYSGTGPQSAAFSLPGDGALHTVEVIDLTDGTCTLSRDITAPDCGQAPMCNLFLSAQETGFCLPDDRVNVALSVMAVNAGNSGFNVSLDGNLVAGSPFTYVSGGNTTLDILVPGDGQNHVVTVTDAGDPTCSASTSLTTTNCTIPCELTNLTASTGGAGTVHIVGVEDFVFAPRDITIAAGDRVEWRWTGQIAHTATSDATTGPDSWESGLLNTGATFQSPVLSAGLHPYYCIPHGAPNGVGMAGTITVLPDCTDGQVAVSLTFNSAGTGAGYNVFVDGTMISNGPFAYDPSGTTSTSVFVAGDGQSHSIEVRDTGSPNCAISTVLETDVCPTVDTCSMSLATEIIGGCDEENNVLVRLTINNDTPGENGFNLLTNGTLWPGSPFDYVNDGETVIEILVPATGQTRTFSVVDALDADCVATQSLSLPNCTGFCTITDLEIVDGLRRHEVEVRDFDFFPRDLTVTVGDTVVFIWTGQIPHTSTSDEREGPLVWESGLLGQGAEYEVVITEPGFHGYYCIPHGGPNGIGMAGSITATEDCTDGQVTVPIRFNASLGGEGFRVFLDGEALDSTYTYDDPNGVNEIALTLPGDGLERLLTIQDLTTSFCAVTITFRAPDCNAGCDGFSVGFTFTPEPDFTISFDGEAAGTTDWLWGFGDGQTSREQNPVHQYAAAGEYRVCLLAQDSLNDCTSNYCETIVVGTVATGNPMTRTRLLNVYPNPIGGNLPTWTLTGLRPADLGANLPVRLLDVTGRLILERNLTGVPELRFTGPDNLPSGIYLLSIRGASGNYLAKVIVQ